MADNVNVEELPGKFRHVLQLIDKVEASADKSLGRHGDLTVVDTEALNTLIDFCVNHCGEDELPELYKESKPPSRERMQFTVKDVKRQFYKHVPVAGGGKGTTMEPDGYQIADIVVTINEKELASKLGLKAMAQRGKYSQILYGTICAQAINIRKVDE